MNIITIIIVSLIESLKKEEVNQGLSQKGEFPK